VFPKLKILSENSGSKLTFGSYREYEMDFGELLRNEIKKGLPGSEVQWEMASSDRRIKDFPRHPRHDSATAAVLILLFPDKSQINTVFIQRPNYKGVHGGQISFPGGKREKSDKTIEATALREAAEETGINPDEVTITGTLTPLFIPVSNILVTPVTGYSDRKPDFVPDSQEVLFTIEAAISHFTDPGIIKTGPFDVRGEQIDIRYFPYNGHIIWGATAMILNELLALIRRGDLPLYEPKPGRLNTC
jgi:8-oxo-dGTP pyrophosphatase MutT (NUDIX family)